MGRGDGERYHVWAGVTMATEQQASSARREGAHTHTHTSTCKCTHTHTHTHTHRHAHTQARTHAHIGIAQDVECHDREARAPRCGHGVPCQRGFGGDVEPFPLAEPGLWVPARPYGTCVATRATSAELCCVVVLVGRWPEAAHAALHCIAGASTAFQGEGGETSCGPLYHIR